MNLSNPQHVGILSDKDQTFVQKGWGSERWIWNNEEYCGKILEFKKGKKCSWHKHFLKDECFLNIKGKVQITYGWSENIEEAEKVILEEGQVFHIPRGLIHQALALEDSTIIEFSTQHFDEDSIRITPGD